MSANLPPLPSPVANLCTSLYPRIVIEPGGFSADQMRAYATAALASQAAELEALRADAERYRWLRDGCDDKLSEATRIAADCYGMEWDAAIDAARAALKEQTP